MKNIKSVLKIPQFWIGFCLGIMFLFIFLIVVASIMVMCGVL